jgi:hypothetical protein
MAKKEEKPKTDKPFKVQGWKKKSEQEKPLAVDLSFEELIKLSVSGADKEDKPKSK